MATERNLPPALDHDELTFSLEGFHETLQNNLFAMWQMSQFCDLILKVPGGEMIPVHSCLMAAFSPTIRDVLSKVDAHFHERGEFSQKYVTVDVKKFSARVIKIIVFSVYTGQLVVAPPEIMEQLLNACRWLKMEHLIVVLEKAMRDNNIAEHSGKKESCDDNAGASSSTHGITAPGFSDEETETQDFSAETSFPSDTTMQSRSKESTGYDGFKGASLPPAPDNENYIPEEDSHHKSVAETSSFSSKMLPSSSSAISNELSSSQDRVDCFQELREKASSSTVGQSSPTQNSSNLVHGSTVDSLCSNDNENTKQKNGLSEDNAPSTQSSTATTSQRNDVSGSRQLRKGTRPRKKSQKWAENFFSNCLYSYEKTFLDAVVPQIKTEVDDLASYLKMPMMSSDQMDRTEGGGPGEVGLRGSQGAGVDATKKRKMAAGSDNVDEGGDCESGTNDGPSATTSASFNYMNDRFSLMDYYNRQNFNVPSTSFGSNNNNNNNANQMMDFGNKFLTEINKRKGRKNQFPLDKRRKSQFPIYKKMQYVFPEVGAQSSSDEDDDDDDNDDDYVGVDEGQSAKDGNGELLRSYVYGRVKRKKRKMGKSQIDPKQEVVDDDDDDDDDNFDKKPSPAKKKKKKKGKSGAATSSLESAITKVKKKREVKVKKERKARRKKKIGMFVNRIIKPSDASNALEDMKQAESDILVKITNGESAKCIRCGVWFKDGSQYADHISNHPIFNCPDCPTQFYLKRNLTRHRFTIHMDKSYLHCKECPFQAKTAIELCRHSGTEHNQPKPFKCENAECTFRATTYSDVQRHFKEIHTSELEYFCEKCGAGFTYKSLFTYHVQRCLKNETHLCYKCGATFHAKADLTAHIAAVHFNIRKYKCPKCDHRFASTSNLKRHLYIHDDVYPFTCPRCGKRFRHSNSYKTHMEKMHGNSSASFDEPSGNMMSSHNNMNSSMNMSMSNMNSLGNMNSMSMNNNMNMNMGMGAGPDVAQAAMNLSFLVAQGIRGWP